MVSDVESKKSNDSIKFLCSYGGKIVPRSMDGKLRYVGGLNRVLSVDRFVSFAELMVKLGELCGYSVTLTCQLPGGDLETLISVKSDEDLANIIEEYDRASSGSKIRAVLSPPKSLKQISPPPSNNSSINFSPTKQPFTAAVNHQYFVPRRSSPQFGYPVGAYRECCRGC
ncbi:hypothetical protein HS088_TW19G00489 [Tripterygium wilfordii]|uniref:PB1 domain-containing protein n=1 Tax=Tripterygium wilfordii TaxID=458696 RepID=A0A7J7CAJ7_TRIWF|nr:uncharacterized protein LOC119985816 [Tripterygium wilfordii]KAF5730887.1 hypothetical protein HS088_TW19G00489 [Tripterygium wilfordii]